MAVSSLCPPFLSYKPEFLTMNAMRLARGSLFLLIASKTWTLARAQDVEQLSATTVCHADPPEERLLLSTAQEEKQRALSLTIPISDPTTAAPDQHQSTTPSIMNSPDNGFVRCWRPCNNPCPCVYGQVDALFLMRYPRIARQPIVVDSNTNTTFLSTSDINSNFNPGLWATFGLRLRRGRALEFDYFGLFEGNASAVTVKPDPSSFLTFPNNLAGNVFVDMDRAQVNYASSLQSFAVNLACCCGCCDGCADECGCGEVRCRSFSWFGGFRYLNLGERLNISAQRTVSGAVEEGAYNIHTTNNLYGMQLGGRLRRTRGRFGWESTGAAGIFGNDAQQRQSVTDFPNFPLRPTVSSSRGEVAFVSGANFSALYLLNNVWNLRAGYNILWIEGLALAPDQLDFNFAASQSGNQLHNGGGVFFHGVNVGLEARW